MRAQEALDSLNPQAWAETPAIERLALIEAVQENLKAYASERPFHTKIRKKR